MQTVYDPTCGGGSLLLKVAAQTPSGIAIYGQELDNAPAAFAAMNMWLHGEPTAEIKRGESPLSNPLFLNANGSLKTFDYAVANPPFSTKAWRSGFDPANDLYERFTGYGIPPAKNGDYAFLLHILRSLKSNGKGAVILPHGVLFRGNVEGEIRSNIVKRGYIKGIIGLPANLFYGTGIPACIVVLDKENAAGRRGIFMIDASKNFVKDGNKNRLRELDIPIDAIRTTVLSHKEFEAFRGEVLRVFASWRKMTTRTLKNISTEDHPKAIIQAIAADLLTACVDLCLVDKYDIYQHLMSY